MNLREQYKLQREVADLTERVESMERLLGLRDPEPVDVDNAQAEGAQVDLEEAVKTAVTADKVTPAPLFEGVQDLGGGWFNVFWGGSKINTKALRKGAADNLLDQQRAAGQAEAQQGAAV